MTNPMVPDRIQQIEINQIVDIADLARLDPNVIKLWIGEPDIGTPQFIIDATVEAMQQGETRYTYSLGLPDLHAALARYHKRHWDVDVDPARFSATIGGMNAIMQVFQSVVEPGDEVVIPCPTWPNILEVARIVGGVVRSVPFEFAADGTVTLELDAIFAAVTEKTKAIAINSPSNPTGWVMSKDEMIRLRDFARERGLWLIADEVYAHFVYPDRETSRTTSQTAEMGQGVSWEQRDKPIAPSFLEVCEPEDRLLIANTFSKNWCMTGWRSGWVVFPQELGTVFDNLSQYNTTSTPTFIQRGCVTALDEGDEFIKMQVARCHQARDIFAAALDPLPNVTVYKPRGTFYMWIAVAGVDQGFDVAVEVLKQTSVGIAPGSAFGPGGERFMRVCFAVDPSTAEDAADRLAGFLGKYG